METLERAKKLLKASSRIAERELIEHYVMWLGKTVGSPERFLSVVGLGCYGEDLETFGNLINMKIRRDHSDPGDVLRQAARNAVQMACGHFPPPMGKPHKSILVPLPSLMVTIGPRKVKKILESWKGTTLSYDLPYCIYTAWK